MGGWNLVGIATMPGADRTFLHQDPSTLNCIVSFSGSNSVDDWVHDLAAVGHEWCGFDEVHDGFRVELEHMARSESFKFNVLRKLPKCAELYVTGHSLGGAMAELFAACTNRAPQPGLKGAEDYK